MDKLRNIIEENGWIVHRSENDWELEKWSPAGRDFVIDLDDTSCQSLIEDLHQKILNFDISEDTYAYLDASGHGTNGAPYLMIDVYKDSENCLEMMRELYQALLDRDEHD